MAVNNYGYGLMPKIVRFAGGKERTSQSFVALDSAALYLGGFVPLATGADATPSGAEFGIPAFTDDARVFGFVTGMHRQHSMVPLWDDPLKAGTVTDATGYTPVKYTFSASNDESNTTAAIKEMVDVMPIVSGDILEVTLWGGAAAPVSRGTTTAAGTTTSSANIGVGMAVAATYDFALLESGAAKLLANLDFMTVELDGQKPANPNRAYVMCIRGFNNFVTPE